MLAVGMSGAAWLVGIGLAWVVSFAVCYVGLARDVEQDAVHLGLVGLRLPADPPAVDGRPEAASSGRSSNVFDSPADVKTPFDPITTAILALVLASRDARRWCDGGRADCICCWLRWLFVAGGLGDAPVPVPRPAADLPGPGDAHAGEPRGGGDRRGRAARGWRSRSVPSCCSSRRSTSPGISPIQPLSHTGFDSHGDLRHDLLDYLDELEAGRSKR